MHSDNIKHIFTSNCRQVKPFSPPRQEEKDGMYRGQEVTESYWCYLFSALLFSYLKRCEEIIKCVSHLTCWIIEAVAETSALFIEKTTGKPPVRARPPTVKGSGWRCHLSPRSPERRPNNNYISSIMWLLLRLVCWSPGGTSGSKHRLLNREWTLAVLRVPVNPEWRKESAAERVESLYEVVIGAFHQSRDTKQGVKVCGNTSKPLRFGLPREPLQANVPTFRLVAFQSLVVMATGLLVTTVT